MNDPALKSDIKTLLPAGKEIPFECHVRSRSAPNGPVTTLQLKAPSMEEMIQKLLRQGFIIVSVKPVKGTGEYLRGALGIQAGKRAGGDLFPFLKKVSTRELIFFGVQLSTLIKAGIPLLRSLEIIGKGMTNPAFQGVLAGLQKRISEGSSFTAALASAPKVFPWIWVNLVEVGETTGKLPECLEEIAHYQEASARIKAKVITAFFYPGVLLAAVTAALTFLLIWVVPKFTTIFTDQKMELPVLTKIVIAASDLIRFHFSYVLFVIIAAVVTLLYLRRSEKARVSLDLFFLSVPIFGPLSLQVGVVRFARSLSTLLRSGVQIIQALDISGKLIDNRYLESQVKAVAQAVKSGQGLGTQLEARKVFPVFMTQLLSTGEESGQMENFLTLIADYYEEAVDAFLARLSVLLEPVMLVFMGVVIGIIVIAMFLPIVELSTTMQ